MMDPAITAVLGPALREHMPTASAIEPHLRAVLEDATSRPGRMMRGRLVFVAARSHGLPDAAAARLAVGIEYFHLASVLLDDLPCMDDAGDRRGRPCPHLQHGEASVILAALALINRAYTLIGFVLPAFPAALRLPAQACLDSCLGPAGAIGGQAADLRFVAGHASAREAGRIALRKTGALFHLTILLPAYLARPSLAEFRQLKAVCVYWGLAYQLADDLADYADAEDRASANLARILGPTVAKARLARLRRRSAARLKQLLSLDPRWSYLAAAETELLPARCTRRPVLAA